MCRIVEKLEKDRVDLIHIIATLRIEERATSHRDKSLSWRLTAHMMRLSQLDAELRDRQ